MTLWGNARFFPAPLPSGGSVGLDKSGRGVFAVLRCLFVSLCALAATGCASVQISLPLAESQNGQRERDMLTQRVELTAAVDRLDDQPWSPVSDDSDGLMGLLFGKSGTSPREQAEAYLAELQASPMPAATALRRDLDETLAAIRDVAATGREATTALEPIPSDLRLIEDAIVEARSCRLVYTEALALLARDDASVRRDDIRAVKKQFNEIIIELGETADLLSARMTGEPAQSFAENQSAL